MADWKVECADGAVGAIGHAGASDVTIAEWPARSAAGEQPTIFGLGVERDDAHAAQVGELARWLPVARHLIDRR
jgi:hypothetical protein